MRRKKKESSSSDVIIYMEYVCEGCVFNFKVFLLGGICAEMYGLVLLPLSANANVAHLETFYLTSSGSNVCHQCVLLFILVHHVFCISSFVIVSPLPEEKNREELIWAFWLGQI